MARGHHYHHHRIISHGRSVAFQAMQPLSFTVVSQTIQPSSLFTCDEFEGLADKED